MYRICFATALLLTVALLAARADAALKIVWAQGQSPDAVLAARQQPQPQQESPPVLESPSDRLLPPEETVPVEPPPAEKTYVYPRRHWHRHGCFRRWYWRRCW